MELTSQMSYSFFAFLSVTIFAFVHLWAQKTQGLDKVSHGRFLSAGGGIALAYVFVDLLPKLCINDQIVREAFAGFFPYFERHVYVMALIGFLLFFFVDRSHTVLGKKASFWLSLSSYALFNFFVGYAVVDKDDPEVQPLALFTLAIGLHYFTNDYNLSSEHGKEYKKREKWILIASLYLGWIAGLMISLPPAAIALMSAFIGGGVIMNVTRHELPKENPHSLGAFVLAAFIYTAILLSIGA
jgi:hypothetical protein